MDPRKIVFIQKSKCTYASPLNAFIQSITQDGKSKGSGKGSDKPSK